MLPMKNGKAKAADNGEVAEWSNAAVSKTVVLLSRDRGFESPPLRKVSKIRSYTILLI